MRPIEKLLDMPVVSAAEGSRLGTLEGVEIDPAGARIAYLRLKPEGKHRKGVIPWAAVQSVGADVILVHTEAAVDRNVPQELRPELTPHVGDRPVLTESGDDLGHISSYDVDEATGRIERYHVRCKGLLASLKGRDISFSPGEIRTFGHDAIIVLDSVVRRESAGEAERPRGVARGEG